MSYSSIQLIKCFLLLGLVLPSAVVSAQITTVQLYDANSPLRPNTVNRSGTAFSVSQFTNDVFTTFTANAGGVIDFESGSLTPGAIDAIFAGGSNTLRLTNPQNDWSFGTTNNAAISGSRVLFDGSPRGAADFFNSIVIGDITNSAGGLINDGVVKFGFSVLDLSTGRGNLDLDIQTTFSNGTSVLVSDTILASNFNNNDTFYGFEAPDGAFITQIDYTATNNLALDDIAFITSPITAVPEPTGVLILVGVCGTIALCRRRSS